MNDARQGIVHVIGPEQGATLPGMTVVCGDSHTSTHGGLGALAFGIGSSELVHVIATQTMVQRKPRRMRASFEGKLLPGVTAKDMILHLIGELGTAAYRVGGIFATESGSFDGAMAFVTLRAAQSQLALGSRVSTINLRLRDRAALAGSLSDLRQRVAAAGLSFQPWQELLPQLEEMVRMIRIISHILLAIAFVVIAMAIMNTVFMAVTERTREFGVMMALGTPPAATLPCTRRATMPSGVCRRKVSIRPSRCRAAAFRATASGSNRPRRSGSPSLPRGADNFGSSAGDSGAATSASMPSSRT